MLVAADLEARDREERAQLAALERLQYEVESVEEFVRRMAPKFWPIPWHLQPLYDFFELSRHEETFATVAMPPRHGKSTSIELGLAWRVVVDPACLNFYASFGDRLSKKSSRKVRKLVRLAGAPLSKETSNVHEWETAIGGGLKATSVGADVTGRGCNGGIVVGDDLIKGRKASASAEVREATWDWLTDDLMSRLEPGSSMLINATRWHEDDPIGRLLSDGLGLRWNHIELPAVLGPDDRAADERTDEHVRALWPQGGYDLARLAKIRLRGEHGWWSLFQQKPTPKGGGLFKRADFVIVDDVPRGGRIVRRWDLAASTDKDAAFTAGVKVHLVDGKLFVSDVRRGQWSPHQVDEQIVQTANEDGRGVEIWLPQDPGQAGKAQKAHLAAKLHGYTVRFDRESADKVTRADPYASQVEAGNVHLVRAPWNRAFLGEHEAFPAGKVKDQVDAMSGAYLALITSVDAETAAPGIAITPGRSRPVTSASSPADAGGFAFTPKPYR